LLKQAFVARLKLPTIPAPLESLSMNKTCAPLLVTTALNVSPVFKDKVAVQSLFTEYVPT